MCVILMSLSGPTPELDVKPCIYLGNSLAVAHRMLHTLMFLKIKKVSQSHFQFIQTQCA